MRSPRDIPVREESPVPIASAGALRFLFSPFHNLSFCEWAHLARATHGRSHQPLRSSKEFINVENRGVHHRGRVELERYISYDTAKYSLW